MNPLNNSGTLTNGNLDFVANASSGSKSIFATTGVSSGKWYWEMTVTTIGNSYYPGLGIETNTAASPDVQSGDSATGYMYLVSGQKYNGGTLSSYGATYNNGDVIGVALDMDAGTITFYKNNTSQGQAFSGITGTARPVVVGSGSTAGTMNFGQRPFAYTAPSGFKALCTQNLPTPTIGATSATLATSYFNPVLYTGDRTSRTISVGFQPDWVWVKSRSAVDDHYLMNAVVGTGKYLSSNSTAAETTNAATLTAYTSDGFSIGNTGTTNETSRTYVAWNWRASGSTVSNTAGSITSTVSANTTAGFSIVTYTGTGANATVGHGLGVAPSMLIIKRRDSTSNWLVYQISLGNTKGLVLNATQAESTDSTYWNNTSPTSSVFSLGSGGAANASAGTMVAYCFAPIAGYSAFGSYTGNGSADGPFVFTGFRPALIIAKQSSASGENWFIIDATRNTYNVANFLLKPNLSAAEETYSQLDFLSNGFKIRNTGTGMNSSGATMIYACFAQNPFKYSLAR
jgi:hypothetical protein